jgi:hypothetical protein
VTKDGVTIFVEIYRMAGRDRGWTREVVDHEGGSTVWDTAFETAEDAQRIFMLAFEIEGIRSFAEAPISNRLNLDGLTTPRRFHSSYIELAEDGVS